MNRYATKEEHKLNDKNHSYARSESVVTLKYVVDMENVEALHHAKTILDGRSTIVPVVITVRSTSIVQTQETVNFDNSL